MSGSEPGTNPVRKILASVSSLIRPISLACSSWDAGPGPVSLGQFLGTVADASEFGV